jgi:hypothetical protein
MSRLPGSTFSAILLQDSTVTSDTVFVFPDRAGGKQAVALRLVDTVAVHRKAAQFLCSHVFHRSF